MNDQRDDEADKVRSPGDRFDGLEPAPIPVAPDGGIAPGWGNERPELAPPPTPEFHVCARGPCRHYWELAVHFHAGNATGSWGELGVRAPRQLMRSCLVHAGTETEFHDDVVYACDRWDPLEPEELAAREARRRRYLERHPDIAAAVAAMEAMPSLGDLVREAAEAVEANEEETKEAAPAQAAGEVGW